MIISDNPQGSDEWLLERSCIPTGSCFNKIISSTGKSSTSSKAYMNELLANYEAGKPVDAWEGNSFTQIGTEREPESRDLYSFLTDNEVTEVGLCFKDDKKLVAVSPDGLVGDDGLVEFKNPKASTLIGYRLANKLPSTYVPQVQGQLWVTDRQWCDFMVNHPDIEHFMIRVERDEKFIKSLESALSDFIDEMLEKREQLNQIKKAA
jgi:hypothetical protein